MATITVFQVGRLRGKVPGWAVCVTKDRKGFMRTLSDSHCYTKLDSERFWEDEDGWYMDPKSERAQICDAAVKRFVPWRESDAPGIEST